MGRRSRSDEEGGAGSIEFLAPDPSAFGPTSSTPVDTAFDAGAGWDDGGRPRSSWAGIGAVAVVAALVAGSVAVAAPWRDDAVTPTTTTVPPTLLPTEGATGVLDADTADADEPTRGMVLEPPTGWRLAGALSGAPFGNFTGWGEVWAQAGSTRGRGAWYALSITPFGLDGIGLADAVRVRVDTRTALVQRAADGVLTLAVAPPFERRDRLVRIEARGTTVDELAAFAASIGIDSDRPQLVDDRFVYRDPAFLEPMTQVWSGPTDWDPIRTAVVDDVLAYTLYTDDAGGWLWLGVHGTEGPLPVVAMLEFEQQLIADIGPPGATDLVIGRSPRRAHTWFSYDDRWVSAISTLSQEDLAEVLVSVRRASTAEWERAQRAEGGVGRRTVATMTPIAQGSLESGTTWDVRSEPLGVGTVVELRLDPTERANCCRVDLFDDVADPLGIVSTLDVTLVVSRFPGPHTLRITTSEGTIDQAADGPIAVPVLAFGDLRVELVDAAGQVIDTE